MARFIAIPVQVGDAFYLERDGRSVLVDGGKSRLAFPDLFRNHVNREGADITVCTHNDSDHTNGIIGFLEAGLPCREIWLPGRWLDSLKDLLVPQPFFINKIVNDAVEYYDTIENRDKIPKSLEELGNALLERGECRMNATGNSERVLNVDESTDWIHYSTEDEYDSDEEIEEIEWENYWESWWRWHIPPFHMRIPRSQSIIFWKIISEAIQAGNRIRRIARLAFDNGIPVRWFEHDSSSSIGGIQNFLIPLGARQITRVYPYMNLLYRLSLTVVNKESLVLYSPPDLRTPGVLFCADSDLHNICLPLNPRDLITVPHHGAKANINAYNAISNALGTNIGSATWVRSDCKTKHRPCPDFLKIPGKKFCTVCKTGPPKHRILMIGRRGIWARHSGVPICQC